MVAGKQDLGYLVSLEHPRAGILRMLEKIVLETLVTQTAGFAQNPGQQPNAGLNREEGRRLAAGEHRVPHADLLEPARLDDPLVHALEPPTKDDHPGMPRPGLDPGLCQ